MSLPPPPTTDQTTPEQEPEFKSQRHSQSEEPGSSEADHLASFTVDDFGDDAEADGFTYMGEDGEPIPPAPEKIDPDQFWIAFEAAFSFPGTILPDLRPLAIQPEERHPARAASDATYRLLDTFYPAALTPNSPVLMDILTAAPFFIGKALLVREILRSKQAKDVTPPEKSGDPQPEPKSDPIGGAWHDEGEAA